jgi:hypothetical protein
LITRPFPPGQNFSGQRDGFRCRSSANNFLKGEFMKELTNADRAARARKALSGYNGDNDAIVNAVDFLTDLQHYYHIQHARHPCLIDRLASVAGKTHRKPF